MVLNYGFKQIHFLIQEMTIINNSKLEIVEIKKKDIKIQLKKPVKTY